MQGIKYHSPKRHKKSLKHARLLVLQRFYFLQTVKDGNIIENLIIVNYEKNRRKLYSVCSDYRQLTSKKLAVYFLFYHFIGIYYFQYIGSGGIISLLRSILENICMVFNKNPKAGKTASWHKLLKQ